MRATSLTALDAIFARRSVREYAPQMLDAETVRSLLDAAIQAPTAVHEEPWAFVVVQDPKVLKRVSERAKAGFVKDAAKYRDLHPRAGASERAFVERLADPSFSIFYNATTLIVTCAKPLGPFVAADCWLAAENLMLAACALGLGSCVIGSAVGALNAPETKVELGIPDEIEAVAPIIVGVPAGAYPAPAARKDPYVLNWI